MKSSLFNEFKIKTNKQCELIYKTKPYLTKGQIIFDLIKEEFPSIAQRIKKTLTVSICDDKAINEMWEILQRKFF